MTVQNSAEEKLTRFEDLRELRNLMGRMSAAYLTCDQASMYQNFWSQKDDVSLGINDGYFVGTKAIKDYYQNQCDHIRFISDLIKARFPDRLTEVSEDNLFGIGQLDYKPVDTHVIEIAGDRKTAKGIWCLRGSHAAMTTGGPQSMWEWGWFAADFCMENGEWKIWHLLYLQEVLRPTGHPWYGEPYTYETLPEYAALAEFQPVKPTHPITLREHYHPGRAFLPTPRIPEPYETFAKTFSYGWNA